MCTLAVITFQLFYNKLLFNQLKPAPLRIAGDELGNVLFLSCLSVRLIGVIGLAIIDRCTVPN